MLKVKRISHVAVAVPSIDESLGKFFEVLGLQESHREVVLSQKVEAAIMPLGEAAIELISPKGSEGVQKFLEKRGPGLHHIAIEVEGLDEGLAYLKSKGVPLIDEVARVGAHGHRVAFIHPKATGGVLLELVEPIAPY